MGKYAQLFHLLLLLLALLLRLHGQVAAQAGSTGYNCSDDRSIYPCQAYAFYHAGADSSLLDLPSIGDLFGVSRLMIAKASNLSTSAALSTGQPLLIPMTCSCSSNRSYAGVTYQINSGDTFYAVSTIKFENLTAYPAVEMVNPSLVPTNLTIGVEVIFPLFCQCPNSSISTKNRAVSLVTYVFQPSDTFSSIAPRFGSDVQSLVSVNGREGSIRPYSTILIPVSQIPPPLLLNHSSEPPPSPPPAALPHETRERKGVIAGLAIGLSLLGFLLVLLLMLLTWLWRRYSGREKRRSWEEEGGKYGGKGKGGDNRFGRSLSDEKLMTDISEWLDKYKVYRIEELREATSDFDRSRQIQGSVYKGFMHGEAYAIKKMKWNACDELKILQKVNHTNLVKLEGFCIEPDVGTCYLIYEFVENGSLHSWLHDPTRSRAKLDWRSRLRIALDLANGLQYIHEHTWPRVVHKDIKSSNVLLDAKMRAKIANFGLAKTGCNAVTAHIVGTQGYIAPEYLSDGLVTTKMDVFAYGVVLLELISGREAMTEEGAALWMQVDWISERRDGRVDQRLLKWLDPALVGQSCPVESVVNVMNLAKACLHRDPAKRPSMVDVSYTLSKVDDLFSDFSEEGLTLTVDSGDVIAR